MKFISFIASMMLIVLISQHSITGVPIEEPVVEKKCSEGFELRNGECMPIKVESKENEINSLSEPNFTTPVSEHNDVCPEGMERGKNGQCENLAPFKTKELINEPTAVRTEDSFRKDGSCPEGMKHGKHGICEKINALEIEQVTGEPKLLTDIHEQVTGEPTIEQFTHEPEIDHFTHGPELDEFTSERMTEKMNSESMIEQVTGESTPYTEEIPQADENLSGCPEGTKHDEQGACQEINPSNSTKITVDPKDLLNKDGSCPENYKKVQDKCLYIKPKTQYSLGLIAGDSAANRLRPKSGNSDSTILEKVPVLPDNSCPYGTEYIDHGLCQKRLRPTNAKHNLNSNGNCPEDFEFIDGRCTYKNSNTQSLTTMSNIGLFPSEITTPLVQSIDDETPLETTTLPDSDFELPTGTTPLPL